MADPTAREPFEPLPEDWSRALCVVAHPDDMEFGAAAAVARWTGQGKEVVYCMVTSGEAGIDGMEPEECRRVREAEQVASAQVVGVPVVEFLGQPDGIVEYGVPLRRAIAHVVRRHRPEVVITGNFRDTFGQSLEQFELEVLGHERRERLARPFRVGRDGGRIGDRGAGLRRPRARLAADPRGRRHTLPAGVRRLQLAAHRPHPGARPDEARRRGDAASGARSGDAVFEGEPDVNPGFLALPNVVMTPHMSGWTTGTINRRRQTIADNISRRAAGRPCVNVVRPART